MYKLLATASAMTVALFSIPAAAQDAPDTFDGLYVSGAVSLDNVDNGAKGLQFDVNRNGVFGDTVNTTTGANAFAPGFCTGAANGNNVGAGCTGDGDDIGYAVRVGFD